MLFRSEPMPCSTVDGQDGQLRAPTTYVMCVAKTAAAARVAAQRQTGANAQKLGVDGVVSIASFWGVGTTSAYTGNAMAAALATVLNSLTR